MSEKAWIKGASVPFKKKDGEVKWMIINTTTSALLYKHAVMAMWLE